MNIINNNPYRLLGVYSNSSIKERAANEGKLKVFLKVGKRVVFPLDLEQILPSIKRTVELVSTAVSQLTLPADQIKYAQFWFLNVTPIDKIAFNHLLNGDMDHSIELWNKAVNASSLQNRIVCYLIRNDYESACKLAEQLYLGYATQFIACISDNITKATTSLGYDFLEVLCNEIGVETILEYVGNSDWRKHICAKAIDPVIARLQSAIDAAKAMRGKGSLARYKAGVKLMNGTKKDLTQLKTLLSVSDLQYQMIADKLGLEILQCGIDYFNDSDEPDAGYKAMELQQYALSVVVGNIAKGRCQENVDILTKIIDSLPPKELIKIADSLNTIIQNFKSTHTSVFEVIDFIKECAPYLADIREIQGEDGIYYRKISTQVEEIALGTLIDIVNVAIKKEEKQSESDYIAEYFSILRTRTELETTVKEAWDAMAYLSILDIESHAKIRLQEQTDSLRNIMHQLHVRAHITSIHFKLETHKEIQEREEQRMKQRAKLLARISVAKSFEVAASIKNACNRYKNVYKDDTPLSSLDDKCYELCHIKSNYEEYLKLFGYNAKHKNEAEKQIQKIEKELGLFDMSGNVSEWCEDWYFNSYAGSGTRVNPTGPQTGMYKVYRGGSWNDKSSACRISKRFFMNPQYRNKQVGLRLSMNIY